MNERQWVAKNLKYSGLVQKIHCFPSFYCVFQIYLGHRSISFEKISFYTEILAGFFVPTFFFKLRSDYWITPKCTLLNFTSKTEAICENEETQARIMYSDASVVHRISNCSTYFRKFPNVAYKKVLKKPTLF